MRVVVCGSRRFGNDFNASLFIDQVVGTFPSEVEVIHGGAIGADSMAAQAATRRGLTTREFPADWNQHGRKAGVMRNLQMLDEQPDLVIAFWNGESPGTRHMIGAAQKRGIDTQVWKL